VGDYQAPLFLAWQLTNRCQARCLHCCEESGPDKLWPDELSREEALSLARQTVALGIPYAAFGGGEPMAVPHVWEVFETLSNGGTALKIETNGLPIGEAEADRLANLDTECVQISVDGATEATHEKVRPLGDFKGAVASIRRLVKRKLPVEFVFVPNRHNIHEAEAAYALAAELGVRTFISGPMMRLGRAAQAWDTLAAPEDDYRRAVEALEKRAAKGGPRLAIYPWDIRREMLERLSSPQAMVLVVPNGKLKLLNALPFAPADLRKCTLAESWPLYQAAWRSDEVRAFVEACQTDASLLLHANETWPMGQWAARRKAAAR
jgi:MoaA/NifB/PqqE/SkfB family radical SAM enzyme